MQYLDDDQIFIGSIPLACAIGLNGSIILRKLNYWLDLNRKAEKDSHFRDGFWWSYNTYEEWVEENFRWTSPKTVQRSFQQLEMLGLVISTDRYNKAGFDHTKWYTINTVAYEAFITLWEAHGEPSYAGGKGGQAYQTFLEAWYKTEEYAEAGKLQQRLASSGQDVMTLETTCHDVEDNLSRPSGQDVMRNTSDYPVGNAVTSDSLGADVSAAPEPTAQTGPCAFQPGEQLRGKNPHPLGTTFWHQWDTEQRRQVAAAKPPTHQVQDGDGFQREDTLRKQQEKSATFFVKLLKNAGTTGVTMGTFLEKKTIRQIFLSPIVTLDENNRQLILGTIPEIHAQEPMFEDWVTEMVSRKLVPMANRGVRPKAATVLDWVKKEYPTFSNYKTELEQRNREPELKSIEDLLAGYDDDDE